MGMGGDMKKGDLIQLRYTYESGGVIHTSSPNKLVVCYDPQVITCYFSHGSYKAIQMIDSNGQITSYPIDRWRFEVIE